MQGGGPASVSLKASLAAPNDGGELETQVVVAAMPPSGQHESELPPPEPNLKILPEAKVFARAKSKAMTPKPKLDGAAVALPHPRIGGGSATATPTSQPPTGAALPGATASVSSSAGNTVAHASRVAHPARHVGAGKPGSTGTDAVTVAASSGNAGGGQVDQAPSAAASNPVPPYPADALARGIEGLVLLRVRIGADGRVEEATLDRSSGTPSLDESALSTVRRQWRFEPATRGGVAVSYEALLPIRFTIRAG